MKYIIRIIALFILVISCKLNKILPLPEQNVYLLPGTITQCGVFDCKVITSVKKPVIIPIHSRKYKPNRTYFDGLDFLDSTTFLAQEVVATIASGHDRRNLVVLNFKGEVIERLVENEDEQFIGDYSISKNNQKLLYTTWRHAPAADTSLVASLMNSLFSLQTLNIMDYKTRRVELKVDNFSKEGALFFNDSPWSPDAKKFVYYIKGKAKKKNNGTITDTSRSISGAYIYDTEQREDIKFIEWATMPEWCPDSNVIAYEKQDAIWLYNISTDNYSFFLKALDNYEIARVHWTSDSNYLYIMFSSKIERGKVFEKVYSIKDRKEIPFKPTGMKSPYFSWR